MEETKEYNWKILGLDKKYLPTSGLELVSFNTTFQNSIFFDFFHERINSHNLYNILETFEKRYDQVRIPLKAKIQIDQLLEEFKINNLNQELYLFVCLMQEEYVSCLNYNNELSQPLVNDFQNEKKDLIILLDIIKDTLVNGNKAIKSISFKSRKTKTKTINNFFIINDLLSLIINSYEITLENFEVRKAELLSNTNNLKFDRKDEYWKYVFATILYDFISRDQKGSGIKNQHIRFVGLFLHIAQIPINKANFEIPESQNLIDLISLDEIKYLNTFIKRPKSFFI